MAKTALELSAEELRSYHPDRKQIISQLSGQQQKAWEAAVSAIPSAAAWERFEESADALYLDAVALKRCLLR